MATGITELGCFINERFMWNSIRPNTLVKNFILQRLYSVKTPEQNSNTARQNLVLLKSCKMSGRVAGRCRPLLGLLTVASSSHAIDVAVAPTAGSFPGRP